MTAMINVNPSRQEITECQYFDKSINPDSGGEVLILCGKPLGRESIDLEYTYCHVHRLCDSCKRPCSVAEIKFCIEHSLPKLKHARCMIVEDSSPNSPFNPLKKIEVTQEWVTRANLARLILEPDPELSDETNIQNTQLNISRWIVDLDFERIYLLLKTMNAAAAELSVAFTQGKGKTPEQIRIDRANKEYTKFSLTQESGVGVKKVLKGKKVGPAAVTEIDKAKEDKNQAIILYAQELGTTDMKLAAGKYKEREKAIKGLMNPPFSMSREKAMEFLNK